MSTEGVMISTMPGSELARSISSPPAGAGLGPMLMGSSVVAPSGTLRVAGVLIRLSVTVTLNAPSV